MDKKKQSGILCWTPPTSGDRQQRGLPSCPITDKQPGMSAPERPCMQFMSMGFYCSRRPCPFPHLSTYKRLSTEDKQTQFCKWVAKTPGLEFSPGKGPPSTST